MSMLLDRMDDATRFTDLNRLLAEFVTGVQEVLGRNFYGAHLQGSFAVGDADKHSDVDFIIATNDEVAPEERRDLEALHQRLFALRTPWAQHLEGSYVPRRILRRPDPQRRPLLYLGNGATEFALDKSRQHRRRPLVAARARRRARRAGAAPVDRPHPA
jgi:hypothetical protein